MRPASSSAPWLVLALLLAPGLVHAQDRRNRTTPGLVLETGARHAPCDALTFTPDGGHLLAAGDDKVVRIWPVGKASLSVADARVLRWPIYREQRGGIFALALSPDDGGKRIAIGGFGVKTGLLAVLDRATGAMLAVLEKPLSEQVTWSLAWSPDGRRLVSGSADGDVYRWTPIAGVKEPELFRGTGGKPGNRVRLLAFRDDDRFLVVTADGWIRMGNVNDLASLTTDAVGWCSRPDVLRAVLSPDRRWLAVVNQNVKGGPESSTQAVELINVDNLLAGKKGPEVRLDILVPQAAGRARFPTAVAFDARSERLAVGTQEARDLRPGTPSFARSTGGGVHVYALNGGKPTKLTRDGLPVGYRVDNVAFRPGVDQLAVAGGPDHEVRLFDLGNEKAPLTEVRSPGSCLWAVALSDNGKYLAWKDKLNRDPQHPNARGAGDWRVFALDETARRILPEPPKDFAPVTPIDTLDGWRVETTGSGFVWKVVGPNTDVTLDEKLGLYQARVNQIPRCWTFIKATAKKPLRLAVGHTWGVSLYELKPGSVRLARLMLGHEGEVMAVAASPKGDLLVTAGRDQTIAGWTLEDFPSGNELGATFRAEGGKLVVRDVDPGSPLWEAGLTDGDEMDAVTVSKPNTAGGTMYNPRGRLKLDGRTGRYAGTFKQNGEDVGVSFKAEQQVDARAMADLLSKAEPARQHIFVWKVKDVERAQSTSVMQRPLWRFFPTRKEAGDAWILWRWRDYFYDTTHPEPDRLLGWQVNPADYAQAPTFHPLSNYSGSGRRDAKGQPMGFYNPAKMWSFVRTMRHDPAKVLLADIEPPEVTVEVAQRPVKDAVNPANDRPLRLNVLARSRNVDLPGQRLDRVTLWLDDSVYEPVPAPNAARTVLKDTVTIPADQLRQGVNRITLSVFNEEGGRGEATVEVPFEDKVRPKPVLRSLCVGVNRYDKVRNLPRPADLNFSSPDAEVLDKVFRQHGESRLFRKAEGELLTEGQVTRGRILQELKTLGEKSAPDDWVVLFLSGHGVDDARVKDTSPYRFFYLCADADFKQPATLLTGDDLLTALGKIRCHKLILLDACHSGRVPDPARALEKEGRRFMIFTACRGDQAALEPDPELTKDYPQLRDLRHGLFTEGLLAAIGDPKSFDTKKGRQTPVSAAEMARTIEDKIEELHDKLRVSAKLRQTPVFLPRRELLSDRLKMFCRP